MHAQRRLIGSGLCRREEEKIVTKGVPGIKKKGKEMMVLHTVSNDIGGEKQRNGRIHGRRNAHVVA